MSDASRPPSEPPARRHISRAWWVTGVYAVFAGLWIYASDQVLAAFVQDPATLVRLSVYKGWGFVLVTSVLLLGLVKGAFGELETSHRRLLAEEAQRRDDEAEIRRLHRLYSALSRINQALSGQGARDELLDRVCRLLVEGAGFRLAWVGWHDAETHEIVPIAQHGDDRDGFLASVRVFADDRPEGRGPSGMAFREGRAFVANDLQDDPISHPWRDAVARWGIRAAAAFPIRVGGEACGTLTVYAADRDFFREEEIALLEEAAADVSRALETGRSEEERMRAEAEARRERELVDRILESVPGVIYLYDENGRFVRWNRSFLEVTGYTAEELAGMTPLDFFRGDDIARVAERIGRVFTTGEGQVEAGFLTKDGRAIPYYFTGRRIELEGEPHLVGMGIDISDRVQAENQLRRSEERYHSTLDSIIEGCQLIGIDWRYLFLNEAAAEHNRRPNEELLGRTMQECWPGIEGSPVYALLSRCMDEGVPVHDEIEFNFADGVSRWYDVRAQPVPEGVFVMSIDVTDRRKAQEEAIELQRRLELVVENLREGLVIADPGLDYLYWNPAALALLGFDDVEEGFRRQREFGEIFELRELDGTVLPAERWPLARTRAGDGFQGLHLIVRRLDDPTFEKVISYAGRRVEYTDGRALAFVTLRDVTSRIRAERELREAKADLEVRVQERTAELRSALERAESADRLKSAFLATMSHELRTPLNSIIGFTGIVLQGLAGPLNEEQSRQLGMVRGSARHLLDLINDVLDLSKIEAGQLQVREEPVDLTDVVERVVGTVSPMAERKGLAVRAQVPPGGVKVVTDRRRVEQILLNLLNNAVKFTEQGEVSLALERSGGQLSIRVADTGMGIKPEDLGQLFQPFRQVDTGLTRQHEGTGLGLAICRRLAELLGGGIDVTSTWGRGSTFTLTLPERNGADA